MRIYYDYVDPQGALTDGYPETWGLQGGDPWDHPMGDASGGELAWNLLTSNRDGITRMVPWWSYGLSDKEAPKHIEQWQGALPSRDGVLYVFWCDYRKGLTSLRWVTKKQEKRQRRLVGDGFGVSLFWIPTGFPEECEGGNPTRPPWVQNRGQ